MPNLFNKNLQDIEYSDIQELIDNETPESLTLDYKKDFDFSNLNKTIDGRRNQEIAKDITGLANSSGGYLIYGIKEKSDGTNTPEEIVGIDGKNKNQNIEDWLNQLMTNGKVSPNVNYTTKLIKIPESNKIILVLEINESLNKPHMVLYENAFCYYKRSGTETKKADHLQVKTMFEFKDKYLLDFNNFRKKLNLDKDVDSENFALSHFNQKLIGFQNKEPVVTFTLIPYNLNRNINFIKDRFYEERIKNTKDIPKLFRNFLNKKLDHLGITCYDYNTWRESEHNYYFHIYKNGVIEFSCWHEPIGVERFIKYYMVQGLKDFLVFSKGILEYLKINEFNLNITALNVLDSKLFIHKDFQRYDEGTSRQKLETNALHFEYDLTIESLNKENIKNTLAEFSDNLLAVFNVDTQSENLHEFNEMFE